MKKQHIGVFALILGAALAFGSAEASKKSGLGSVYGRQPDGSWILVTPQTEENFECEPDDQPCKAEYSSDPNLPGATLIQVIDDDGVYTQQ